MLDGTMSRQNRMALPSVSCKLLLAGLGSEITRHLLVQEQTVHARAFNLGANPKHSSRIHLPLHVRGSR